MAQPLRGNSLDRFAPLKETSLECRFGGPQRCRNPALPGSRFCEHHLLQDPDCDRAQCSHQDPTTGRQCPCAVRRTGVRYCERHVVSATTGRKRSRAERSDSGSAFSSGHSGSGSGGSLGARPGFDAPPPGKRRRIGFPSSSGFPLSSSTGILSSSLIVPTTIAPGEPVGLARELSRHGIPPAHSSRLAIPEPLRPMMASTYAQQQQQQLRRQQQQSRPVPVPLPISYPLSQSRPRPPPRRSRPPAASTASTAPRKIRPSHKTRTLTTAQTASAATAAASATATATSEPSDFVVDVGDDNVDDLDYVPPSPSAEGFEEDYEIEPRRRPGAGAGASASRTARTRSIKKKGERREKKGRRKKKAPPPQYWPAGLSGLPRPESRVLKCRLIRPRIRLQLDEFESEVVGGQDVPTAVTAPTPAAVETDSEDEDECFSIMPELPKGQRVGHKRRYRGVWTTRLEYLKYRREEVRRLQQLYLEQDARLRDVLLPTSCAQLLRVAEHRANHGLRFKLDNAGAVRVRMYNVRVDEEDESVEFVDRTPSDERQQRMERMERMVLSSSEEVEMQMKKNLCSLPSCGHAAMSPSTFCYKHILLDEKQKVYVDDGTGHPMLRQDPAQPEPETEAETEAETETEASGGGVPHSPKKRMISIVSVEGAICVVSTVTPAQQDRLRGLIDLAGV